MKRFFLAVCLLCYSTPANPQTPYFQGKTIRIVSGYLAGDVNDLWPRLIAQHMTRYIPGNPTFIIQNMTGASGPEIAPAGAGRRQRPGDHRVACAAKVAESSLVTCNRNPLGSLKYVAS